MVFLQKSIWTLYNGLIVDWLSGFCPRERSDKCD